MTASVAWVLLNFPSSLQPDEASPGRGYQAFCRENGGKCSLRIGSIFFPIVNINWFLLSPFYTRFAMLLADSSSETLPHRMDRWTIISQNSLATTCIRIP
ncbi:TPA: hypothetical protein GDO54_018510 [Pyxicephalus adspersus]|uniref:Uncharacterized protein n=1 Tax=Pyxicephalus adspersus TaxID=30357 RepID=A0AAV2ZNW8_PYXAD|nr:TPA: hypothetical protein GDO54_018510 [Pyxicephalus adspersus]